MGNLSLAIEDILKQFLERKGSSTLINCGQIAYMSLYIWDENSSKKFNDNGDMAYLAADLDSKLVTVYENAYDFNSTGHLVLPSYTILTLILIALMIRSIIVYNFMAVASLKSVQHSIHLTFRY